MRKNLAALNVVWKEQRIEKSIPVFESSHPAIMPCSEAGAPSGKPRLTRIGNQHFLPFMPTTPSIWDYLPQPERDCIPPRERHDRQTWPGYWIFYNRDGSVSFGTETREYFGLLPAEIVRAVPESVINCIACTVFEAHRTGRRDAYTYLKEFVLEKLEVPDWPLDPMPKLPRMTPPPLPPESG
jgi:hypothetical protein